MCGRYTITKKKSDIEKEFDVKADKDFIENYNVAPSSYMPVITNIDSSKINLLKWGLIPYWSKDNTFANNLINARAETIFEKPSFKKNIKKQRCCIVADGYYEWKKENNYKQPYYIHMEHHKLFLFAGIWDSWEDQQKGEKINSFSIITKEATGDIANIHHRVPVTLNKTLKNTWLASLNDSQINELIDIGQMNFNYYPVSKSVNKPQNNYKELINST